MDGPIKTNVSMVARQQAMVGWTRDCCNGPSRDGSHRGPRDQCKPHVSGGSKDSRHGFSDASERTVRDLFSREKVTRTLRRVRGRVARSRRTTMPL